jgi:hypothetical protein
LVGICSKPVGAPNKPADVPDNQITQPGAVSTVRLVNQMVLFRNFALCMVLSLNQLINW